MTSVTKPSARFLPTLTEVVRPVALGALPAPDKGLSPENVALRAMELLSVHMERQIQHMVHAQAQNMLSQLQDEMKQAVARAVAEALQAGGHPGVGGSE